MSPSRARPPSSARNPRTRPAIVAGALWTFTAVTGGRPYHRPRPVPPLPPDATPDQVWAKATDLMWRIAEAARRVREEQVRAEDAPGRRGGPPREGEGGGRAGLLHPALARRRPGPKAGTCPAARAGRAG